MRDLGCGTSAGPSRATRPVEEALAALLAAACAAMPVDATVAANETPAEEPDAASHDHQIRATQVPRLDIELFGQASPSSCASDAFRGLLLALALAKRSPAEAQGVRLSPSGGHMFFHNLQNLWACVNPACKRRRSSSRRCPG